jgi:hypothetical protein
LLNIVIQAADTQQAMVGIIQAGMEVHIKVGITKM